MTERALHAGRVGRPHGLDGSFHVTRPRSDLLELGRSLIVEGESREITRLAGTDARPILRLAGCSSREGAEALRGADLLVPRSDAPALGEDEWYADQLEGCAVWDGELLVGSVRGLVALPSCEALEVDRVDREGDLLVPLVRDAVLDVDVEARRIEISLAFVEGG